MATLTIPQLIQYAENAGFHGLGLIEVVAISLSEAGNGGPGTPASSVDTQASHFNSLADNPSLAGGCGANSYDVGPLQINLSCHPSVTWAQATDPQFAFNYAYQLSNGGTNFSPWTTFTQGVFGTNVPSVAQALGADGQQILAAIQRATGNSNAPSGIEQLGFPGNIPVVGGLANDIGNLWGFAQNPNGTVNHAVNQALSAVVADVEHGLLTVVERVGMVLLGAALFILGVGILFWDHGGSGIVEDAIATGAKAGVE